MYRLLDEASGYLFSSRELRAVLEAQASAMRAGVDSLDAIRLLNTAPADLAAYFAEKFRIEPLVLHTDRWTAGESECRVDVSGDPYRFPFDRPTGPFFIPGQRIQVEVPFEGEKDLFYCRPNTFSLSPPKAQIRGGVMSLTWDLPHDASRDLKPEIQRLVAEIAQHVTRIRDEVNSFNGALIAEAARAIDVRRARLLANQGRLASLGIPVRERADAPKTYAVPSVRRKAAPVLPPAGSTPFEPEPAWEMNHYEHALQVMQNMTAVMERSPSAFATMDEEHLRQHFLVQLNSQFEGGATGETFNASGKTDILLREKGRNVFIAECKFWRGPKAFLETINQLLGYTAWRDTKTAILVFCRDVEMSTVLAGIKGTAEAHPNYKRTLDWSHQSGFRYIFHHPDDRNREFVLTVLAFHVPT